VRYLLSSLFLFAFALSAVAIAGSRTATETERKACEAPIDLEIDSVNGRMRGGYSNSEWKDQRAKCRLVVGSAR
jgi:hypothetical protein